MGRFLQVGTRRMDPFLGDAQKRQDVHCPIMLYSVLGLRSEEIPQRSILGLNLLRLPLCNFLDEVHTSTR